MPTDDPATPAPARDAPAGAPPGPVAAGPEPILPPRPDLRGLDRYVDPDLKAPDHNAYTLGKRREARLTWLTKAQWRAVITAAVVSVLGAVYGLVTNEEPVTPDTLWQALVPKLLRDWWQAYPTLAALGAGVVVALLILAFVLAARAQTTLKRANEVRELRGEFARWRREYALAQAQHARWERTHREVQDLKAAGRPAAAAEQGPPFDLALLPLPAHFVGRERELAWLRARLTARGSATGVAAIGGIGGIGKTGLAAQIIHALRAEGRFPDGIAVVLCRGKTTPADATQMLADVLTRFDPQRRAPEATDPAGLAEAALRLLAGKDALVVLDNVEPGLPIERVVAPLREAGTTLLLTARQALPVEAVPPEGRLSLDLLSEAEARDLLARSLGAPTALDLPHAQYVAAERIVHALGRHTLAVTLAGAYAADVGRDLERLAGELADPQRALKLPRGDAPDAVKRAFASSYEALTDEAQRLFMALAAFPTAEFGRDAAVELARHLALAEPDASVDLLARRALATAEAEGERLRLHPLIQALAVAEFATWPDERRTSTRRAVAEYYGAYADATDDATLGPDEANIAGAIDMAALLRDDALVARLCNSMGNYWRDRSRTDARRRYLPLGVAAAGREAQRTGAQAERRLEAHLRSYRGELLLLLGDIPGATDDLTASMNLYQELGDARGEGVALALLGDILVRRGDLAGAQQNYERCLAIMREVGDAREEGAALGKLGDVLVQRGDLAGAQQNYERYLAIMREAGDAREEGVALSKLGDILRQRGDLAGAQANYERDLAIMREVGDLREQGTALYKLAQVYEATDKLEEAERMHRESLAIGYEVQSPQDIADSLAELGRFLVEHDRNRDEGCRMLNDAIALYARTGLPGEGRARETAQRLGCLD